MITNVFENKEIFKEEYQRRIIEHYGRSIDQAHITEKFMILGEMIRDHASIHWYESKNAIQEGQEKQMYYFSMEFLMGRLLTNNLMNMGVYDVVNQGLSELSINIHELEDIETDAGLGNGGLGRLAACFLDSLASLQYPGHGNCIRYEYGLFKQKIENKEQVEVPDCWMRLGNVWEIRKPKHAVDVKFGGHVNMWMDASGKTKVEHIPSFVVRAMPYDMPIVGAGAKLTNTLRLWSSEVADDACNAINLNDYVNEVHEICRNVYPDDSTEHGKILRLKQQYFFVAAGLNSIIASHLKAYGTLDNFAEKVAIQLNDTHPVLCIPELMRLLMDEYQYEWDDAWTIVKDTFAYTNHTVMNEALEKWQMQYVQELLPRIYMIIEEIDRRFRYRITHQYGREDLIEKCAILQHGQVHMANLAIIGSHSINGVAALHTEILKDDVMKHFYAICPQKFNNKTNGITHRRWLLNANPQLSSLLKKTIGGKFVKEPLNLIELMKYVDNKKIQTNFLEIKLERKKILAAYIKKTMNIEVDVTSIFDIQSKRLHAYKRQLLSILNILDLYFHMKEDPNFRIYPRTIIFAAKAAPSYIFAKEVIKLIHYVADMVNHDTEIADYMKIIFLPNYGVSMAELLTTAADVSEQISTAGKEGSGTSNMKFMMNGAITCGTYDGANVEIVECVGFDNAVIFGLRREEVMHLKNENLYHASDVYKNDVAIHRVIDGLIHGIFPVDFRIIFNELLNKNDEYMVMADFHAYQEAFFKIEEYYKDRMRWARMCLVNIAQSGFFSSDRTIEQYVEDIWHIHKIQM